VPSRTSAGSTSSDLLVLTGCLVAIALVAFGFFREPISNGMATVGRCISQAAGGNFGSCSGADAQQAQATPPAQPPPATPPTPGASSPQATLPQSTLAAMLPSGVSAMVGAPQVPEPGVGTTGPAVPGFKNCNEAWETEARLVRDVEAQEEQIRQLEEQYVQRERDKLAWWDAIAAGKAGDAMAQTAQIRAQIERELEAARDQARSRSGGPPGTIDRIKYLEQVLAQAGHNGPLAANLMRTYARHELDRWQKLLDYAKGQLAASQAQLDQLREKIDSSGCR
jgi:hypothetical protein